MAKRKTTKKKVAASGGTTTKKKVSKKKVAAKVSGDEAQAPKAGRRRKDGLRAPQVRVLEVLADSDSAMTRQEIHEKGSVDLPMLNSYIGSHDEEIRAKNDEQYCTSLLTLGYVKFGPKEEGKRGATYLITAAGKKALDKVED